MGVSGFLGRVALAAFGVAVAALVLLPLRVVVRVHYARPAHPVHVAADAAAQPPTPLVRVRLHLLFGLLVLSVDPKPSSRPRPPEADHAVGRRERPFPPTLRPLPAFFFALRRATSLSEVLESAGAPLSPFPAGLLDEVAAAVRSLSLTLALGLGDAASTAIATGAVRAAWGLCRPVLRRIAPSLAPLKGDGGTRASLVLEPLFQAPAPEVHFDATCIVAASPGKIIVGAVWRWSRGILQRLLRRGLRTGSPALGGA